MKTTKASRTRLLEAPVGKTLLQLTGPMSIGILSMVIFNLADTFFIGQLGKEYLAAISFTFPVVLTISSLAHGIGMGVSIVVSRAIGEGNYKRVTRLATDGLVLGMIIVIVATVIGLLTINPLFKMLGARGVVLTYINEYMRIWYVGMAFVVVPMIGNYIIRATGNTKIPGLIMIVGASVNLILDPMLIFGLGPFDALGIAGAATATIIGRASTFTLAIYILAKKEKLIKFTMVRLQTVWQSWKEILYLGLPIAGTKIIIPVGTGVITRIISSYGNAAVAGFGVATRVEFFSLAALQALAAVVGPFIGQNFGAGKLQRIKKAFSVSRHFSLCVGGGLFFLYLLLAPAIASLFNKDPHVIETAAICLKIVALSYWAQGFYYVAAAGLNALKKPFHAASLSLLHMFGLAIPFALLGSYLFGINAVFVVLAVSYVVTGLISMFLIKRAVKQLS